MTMFFLLHKDSIKSCILIFIVFIRIFLADTMLLLYKNTFSFEFSFWLCLLKCFFDQITDNGWTSDHYFFKFARAKALREYNDQTLWLF